MESLYRHELNVNDIVSFGEKGARLFYAMTLEKPCWGDWKAGQFVMLRPLSWGQEITWARPFSICRVTDKHLILFFQVVGKGTELISKLKPQDKVLVWGPLGNGFAVKDVPTLLIAGGIGVAPFIGYVDQSSHCNKLSMIFAHRQSLNSYPLERLSNQISIDTIHETCANDLAKTLERIRLDMTNIKKQEGLVLACGPMPLLKYIWACAKELELATQLSLEQRMACGVGACLGCVAESSQSFADKDKAGFPIQTCTYGPVFWAHDLNLENNER